MNATYKTTKYELPMFYVTVKTNVGYTPIADFVVQSETGIQIEEAQSTSFKQLESGLETKVFHDRFF